MIALGVLSRAPDEQTIRHLTQEQPTVTTEVDVYAEEQQAVEHIREIEEKTHHITVIATKFLQIGCKKRRPAPFVQRRVGETVAGLPSFASAYFM